jgi:threonine dehydratase
VVTASAGNHALAMAWAAARTGHRVAIYVSARASPAKVDALARLGADVRQVGETYDEAEAAALAAPGTYVSPYNDTGVIAGAATLGGELPDGPLTVVVPLGGGGLAGGLCGWAAERADVRLVGVEAAAWGQWSAALEAGAVVAVAGGETLADGVAGNNEPGSVTFELVRERLDALVAVDEAELRAAMRCLALRQGLVAEGAGALATAAVLAGRVPARGTVVALVTGRNVAAPVLAGVLA